MTPDLARLAAVADDAVRRQRLAAQRAQPVPAHRVQPEIAVDAAADRAPAANVPRAFDLRKLAQCEPKRPAFIVQDWLPQSEVTLFAGHGGTGKSMLALTLAVCIAVGRPFFGLPTQARRVAFLSLRTPSRCCTGAWRASASG